MERPEAMSRCNECNDALETEHTTLAMARRLALVAQNALLNGDLRRIGALLRTSATLRAHVSHAGRPGLRTALDLRSPCGRL